MLTVGGTQQLSTTNSYDALKRLTGTAQGTVTASYGYDDNRNRNYAQYNNGLREEYTSYNHANLLTCLVNENSSGTVLSQYDVAYTLDGNQISKTDQDSVVTDYTYDDLGRLTHETVTESGTVSQVYSYPFDNFNNRATMTATETEAYSQPILLLYTLCRIPFPFKHAAFL